MKKAKPRRLAPPDHFCVRCGGIRLRREKDGLCWTCHLKKVGVLK